ncbi:uncharacterized protein M6B38_285910 [Iris pallida]|uniref:Uncharacterized protein n=1 Tax=Iris pallida TaxID=29817 RepID=A0AAX6EMK3_IRIPA|nr:uncharacterized protein M6B38_181900 [Iris pallida]KAJ6845831.1 uncharacterized protein M6B38_285910 [Iris pallida]
MCVARPVTDTGGEIYMAVGTAQVRGFSSRSAVVLSPVWWLGVSGGSDTIMVLCICNGRWNKKDGHGRTGPNMAQSFGIGCVC